MPSLWVFSEQMAEENFNPTLEYSKHPWYQPPCLFTMRLQSIPGREGQAANGSLVT